MIISTTPRFGSVIGISTITVNGQSGPFRQKTPGKKKEPNMRPHLEHVLSHRLLEILNRRTDSSQQDWLKTPRTKINQIIKAFKTHVADYTGPAKKNQPPAVGTLPLGNRFLLLTGQDLKDYRAGQEKILGSAAQSPYPVILSEAQSDALAELHKTLAAREDKSTALSLAVSLHDQYQGDYLSNWYRIDTVEFTPASGDSTSK